VPAALWVLRPGSANEAFGEDHSKAIRLRLAHSRHPPSIILADVPLATCKLVLIEVVVTDGAVNSQRKAALLELAKATGQKPEEFYFVSAFADRSASAFRKLAPEIAWGTYAWFSSEPEKLLAFREGHAAELPALFQY